MADKRQRKNCILNDKETDDIIEEILVRLSADELARYKLVCKDWRDLIESSNFVSAHINRSNSDRSSHKILVQDDSPWREPGPFNFAACCWCPCARIVGSINGLVCVVGNHPSTLTTPNDIWVLNPVTGYNIKLPPPASPLIFEDYTSVTFAFVWDHSIVTSGYYVVKIVSKSSSLSHTRAWKSSLPTDSNFSFSRPVDTNFVEVWSSDRPNTWLTVPLTFERPFYRPGRRRVSYCDSVVNGVAYWLVADSNGSGCFVVSLDPKTLKLNSIPLPDISTPVDTLFDKLCGGFIPNDGSSLFGATWNDSFALIEDERTDEGKHYYNLWMLDGSGVAWSEKSSFCMNFGVFRYFYSIESKLVFQPYNGLTLFYNPEIGECEVLRNNGFFTEVSEEEFESGEMIDYELRNVNVSSAYDYVGSLLSIDGFKCFEDSTNCPHLVFMWPDGSKGGAPSGMVGNMNTDEGVNDDDDWGKEEERDFSFFDLCFGPHVVG